MLTFQPHPIDVLHQACEPSTRVKLSTALGPGGVLLVHWVGKYRLPIDVFMVDTGYLFNCTLKYRSTIEDVTGVNIRVISCTLPKQGFDWVDHYTCCRRRKLLTFIVGLGNAQVWISAIRRDQTQARSKTIHKQWDERLSVHKVCPLAYWTQEQVDHLFDATGLPHHPLRAKGYYSIGCGPCTSPGVGREGRWADNPKKEECGLHG